MDPHDRNALNQFIEDFFVLMAVEDLANYKFRKFILLKAVAVELDLVVVKDLDNLAVVVGGF